MKLDAQGKENAVAVVEDSAPSIAPLIPAMPIPHPDPPGLLGMVRAARKDLLSLWWEQAYSNRMMVWKILRRRVVICNAPEAVKHVMLTHNDIYERKSPQMRRALEHLLGDGLFISDGATWAFRRRTIAPIVHKNRLDSFVPVMVDTAQEMAGDWDKRVGTEVDALVEMAALTAEIISRAVFGANLGADAAQAVIKGFTDYQKRIDQFNWGYFLGADEGFPAFKGPRLRAAAGQVKGVVDGIIAKHARGEGDANSMIAMLMEVRDPETGAALTPEAIRNEAATIFMAGHETTAATLTWVWYLLSQAPDVEARLHAELDAVLPDGRTATLEDVPRLKYTWAIIEEALRLYPPVPILSRQAAQDDEILGRKVKKGDLILVVLWLLHRHRDLWDDPDAFIPERFLGENRKVVPFSYLPFATGPRICTGASFGQSEAILCLAVLAQRFRLRLKGGHKVMPVCRLTLRPQGGLPMRLERR